MVHVNETRCCAMDELDGIDGKDPQDILYDVCMTIYRKEWGEDDISYYMPAAFYVFTSYCGKTGKGLFKGIRLSGHELASYIKKHTLGVVTTMPVRPNRVNHPDHLVKVWVWAPHKHNLRKWYENTGKKVGLKRPRNPNILY